MLHRYPLLKAFIPIVFGIISFKHFGTVSFTINLLLIVLPLSIYFILNKYKNYYVQFIKGGLFFLSFIALGGLLLLNFDPVNKSNYYGHHISDNNAVKIRILTTPIPTKRSMKCMAEVVQITKSDTILNNLQGKIICYFPTSLKSDIKLADIIDIKGKINPVQPKIHPDAFDYKNYLSNKGIHYSVYFQEDKIQSITKGEYGFFDRFQLLQLKWSNTITNYFSESNDNTALLNTLVLGNQTTLSEDIIESYQKTGLIHILSVSGFHVAMFFIILQALLGKLKNNKGISWIYYLTILFCINGYALLTGASLPAMRSAFMLSVVIIGEMINRKSSPVNAMIFSGICIIAWYPNSIYEIGFQLSFLAVLGLILGGKFYDAYFIPPQNWILKTTINIIIASISAQLIVLPLILYYFHSFPNYFIISNILLTVIFNVILILGGVFILLSELQWTSLMDLDKFILDILIDINYTITRFIANLPFSTLDNIYITPLQMMILFAVLLLFIRVLFYQDKKLILYGFVLLIYFQYLNVIENFDLKDKVEVISTSYKNDPIISVIYKKNLIVFTKIDKTTVLDLPCIKNYSGKNRISLDGVTVLSTMDSIKTSDNQLYVKDGSMVYQGKVYPLSE